MTASTDNAEQKLSPRLALLVEQAKQKTLTAAELDELRFLIDEAFDLLSLMKRWPDGPMTDQERAVHDAWMWAFAGRQFVERPICGGAIADSCFFVTPTVCPCCRNELSRIAIDPVRHSSHEIHESFPVEMIDSVFTAIVYPKGTRACERCGRVYPESYTCCPGLLARAIDLYGSYKSRADQKARARTVAFLETHSDVLLNALRGTFGRKLDKAQRKLLKKIVPALSCNQELLETIDTLA